MNQSFGGGPERTGGYRASVALVVVAFVLLGARLWQLQGLRGDHYYRKTTDNFVKEIDLPATRGEIRDRNGRVLVENRPSWNVYVTPRFLTDEALAQVAKVLRLSDEQVAALRTRVLAKKGLERFQQQLAFEDIGRDEMATLESDKANLPGVAIYARSHRHYPQGTVAAHALGYMNQISADELQALRDQGYHPADYVGRAGIERQFEAQLRGKDGFERIIVDAKGHIKPEFDIADLAGALDGPPRLEPTSGANVILTLDLDLQKATEKSLARYPSAAAVVVEVGTGRILALASHPAFDPNVLTGRLSRAEDERLQRDPFRPMIDKAVRENYFPGSTFKVIPALAALIDGQVTADETMVCTAAYKLPGHTFRCMETHGKINIYSALVESCNIFFYHLGERIGLDRMARLAMDFGFGAPTGIALPGEVPGFIPTLDYYKKEGGFRIGYALNTAIGQGSTKVTLLQLVLAYAALGNGGDLYMPQIVERIETPGGKVVSTFAPSLRRHIEAAPELLDQIKRALCGAVNDVKGTAYMARDPELTVDVCGKTGTAQVRKNRKGEGVGWDLGNDHAWFASFAPAQKPELAVVVLVEHGGLGGHVAAPVAMDIYRAYYDAHPPEKAQAATTATGKPRTVSNP